VSHSPHPKQPLRGKLYVVDGEVMTLAQAKRSMPVYGEQWLREQLEEGVTARKELARRHSEKLSRAAHIRNTASKNNSPYHVIPMKFKKDR
jgi:hypothetical protein